MSKIKVLSIVVLLLSTIVLAACGGSSSVPTEVAAPVATEVVSAGSLEEQAGQLPVETLMPAGSLEEPTLVGGVVTEEPLLNNVTIEQLSSKPLAESPADRLFVDLLVGAGASEESPVTLKLGGPGTSRTIVVQIGSITLPAFVESGELGPEETMGKILNTPQGDFSFSIDGTLYWVAEATWLQDSSGIRLWLTTTPPSS